MRTPKNNDSYEKLKFGFVVESSKGFGTKYHVQTERVLYDWMVEPIDDLLFVNRELMIDLPEGYFFFEGRLYQEYDFNTEKAQSKNAFRQVVVYQEAPVFSKALVIIAGRIGVSQSFFERLNLPSDRIFHIQNPHG